MTIDQEVAAAILEMRDLLQLLAEPAVAERDAKRREQLKTIVGNSQPKATAVMLLDGKHTQLAIHQETKMHQGNLSTLVKQLGQAGLLVGDPKQPKLAISVPPNFFEKKNNE